MVALFEIMQRYEVYSTAFSGIKKRYGKKRLSVSDSVRRRNELIVLNTRYEKITDIPLLLLPQFCMKVTITLIKVASSDL